MVEEQGKVAKSAYRYWLIPLLVSFLVFYFNLGLFFKAFSIIVVLSGVIQHHSESCKLSDYKSKLKEILEREAVIDS